MEEPPGPPIIDEPIIDDGVPPIIPRATGAGVRALSTGARVGALPTGAGIGALQQP
jgi:hypothetical protein